MGRVVVVGERVRVAGFALAGAEVRAADEPADVAAAWTGAEPDVAVLVLTPAAERVLHPLLPRGPDPARPLVVVLP